LQQRDVGLLPPLGSLPVAALPRDIRSMFEQAFGPSGVGGCRPTAAQWATALEALGRDVRRCRRSSAHWYFEQARACPWCDIERSSGVVLFGKPPGKVQPKPAPLPAQPAPLPGQAVTTPPRVPSPAPSVAIPPALPPPQRHTPRQVWGWAMVALIVLWLSIGHHPTPYPASAVTAPASAPTVLAPAAAGPGLSDSAAALKALPAPAATPAALTVPLPRGLILAPPAFARSPVLPPSIKLARVWSASTDPRHGGSWGWVLIQHGIAPPHHDTIAQYALLGCLDGTALKRHYTITKVVGGRYEKAPLGEEAEAESGTGR
jgi:hypothetical protein